MCGLSTVVTPGWSGFFFLQTYREIYFNAYSVWDDNNNNNNNIMSGRSLPLYDTVCTLTLCSWGHRRREH